MGIEGVQDDGGAHLTAAGRTAFTAVAVCLCHIVARIEFSVGYFIQVDVSQHIDSPWMVQLSRLFRWKIFLK